MTSFAVFDADADGYLERDDFERMARRMSRVMGQQEGSGKALAVLEGHRRYWAGLVAEADTDRYRKVSFEEYAQRSFGADSYERYIKPLAESLAALGDVDDDGKISQQEFVALLAAVGFNAADYAAYFQTLDTDGDNAITVDQFTGMLEEFYTNSAPATVRS